jgi:hypothetical protein
MAELEAMPGFRLNVDLAMLGRSGHVMYRNAEELARHADQFMRSRRPFARDANDQIEEFEKELVRYLHNYLTSVYSLIESQRVVMRHCWGDGSEFETGQLCQLGIPLIWTRRRWRSCVSRRVPLSSSQLRR